MPNIDERARHELYLAFENLMGADKADTVMSLLPPVGWADVATKHDVVAVRQDLDVLKRDLDTLRLDVAFKQDLVSLEHRLTANLERGIRDQTRSFVTWMLASQASTITLLVAALAIFR